MISPARLCLAADDRTVVLAGDPRATTLLVGEGCELADGRAKELGVLDDAGNLRIPPKPSPVAARRRIPDPATPGDPPPPEIPAPAEAGDPGPETPAPAEAGEPGPETPAPAEAGEPLPEKPGEPQ